MITYLKFGSIQQLWRNANDGVTLQCFYVRLSLSRGFADYDKVNLPVWVYCSSSLQLENLPFVITAKWTHQWGYPQCHVKGVNTLQTVIKCFFRLGCWCCFSYSCVQVSSLRIQLFSFLLEYIYTLLPWSLPLEIANEWQYHMISWINWKPYMSPTFIMV